MVISLGAIALDGATASVREEYKEAGGNDGRVIVVEGWLNGAADGNALEARLDEILAAVPEGNYTTWFSVRPGRGAYVRREAFLREVSLAKKEAHFKLTLAARDPYDYAEQAEETHWTIGATGDALVVSNAGNAEASPVIALTAVQDLVTPALSDGIRTITYGGVVPAGSRFTVDAAEARVLVDEDDVTPYTDGPFPSVAPPATSLTYLGSMGSPHEASGIVTVRARWW